MDFWEKLQSDVSKGLKDGIHTLKEKAELLTDEGKKKYKAYDLKSKMHKHLAELGATVYSMHNQGKKPLASTKAKGLIEKIAKLEEQIAKLEGKSAKKKAAKKAVKKKAKKKAVKKKTVKKKAVKKKA
ncbi:hypothetical protein KA005_06465 [bacterium]|nr:hypothetical protein [bacterium]